MKRELCIVAVWALATVGCKKEEATARGAPPPPPAKTDVAGLNFDTIPKWTAEMQSVADGDCPAAKAVKAKKGKDEFEQKALSDEAKKLETACDAANEEKVHSFPALVRVDIRARLPSDGNFIFASGYERTEGVVGSYALELAESAGEKGAYGSVIGVERLETQVGVRDSFLLVNVQMYDESRDGPGWSGIALEDPPLRFFGTKNQVSVPFRDVEKAKAAKALLQQGATYQLVLKLAKKRSTGISRGFSPFYGVRAKAIAGRLVAGQETFGPFDFQ